MPIAAREAPNRNTLHEDDIEWLDNHADHNDFFKRLQEFYIEAGFLTDKQYYYIQQRNCKHR